MKQRSPEPGASFTPVGQVRGSVLARPHVDLLAAELQRRAVVGAELLALHAEDALIPGGRDLHVLHVQHDVVDAVDGEAHGGCVGAV